MWKDYSVSFIKKNRASSLSITVAAFISALFLSLICSLFYNFWQYEIERIVLEEGEWQGRIVGDIDHEALAAISNFANVKKAAVNEELSGEQGTVVDLCFFNPRTIYQDMPLITERLGLGENAAEYHELLLSRYMIHDPKDEEPPLLMAFYLTVLVIVSVSLILIIHNSFAVSMNARIHQFGILSSIGAAPKQIRVCLMQEAAALCLAPVLAGSLAGIFLSFGTIQGINILAAEAAGRHEAAFRYHPLVLGLTLLSSLLTVFVSAWLPARKLSRLTPLEAIRNTGGFALKRKKRSRVLSFLFGVEGELAGNALKAQKKALRTSSLSLTLSFLGFTMMLCFFTLSGISTAHTYFERYRDTWDVMITVQGTKIEDFRLTGELRNLAGVKESTVYQKASAVVSVPEDWQSGELTALGGLEAVAGIFAASVPAPIVILDDESFAAYCVQNGISPRLDGTIVLNRIWDSINSNFRYPIYLPYLKENRNTLTLQSPGREGAAMEIPILAYTREMPALREEYADYALVQFIPLSLWKACGGQLGDAEADTYIRILGGEGATLEEINALEGEIARLIAPEYEIESENRIQEQLTNEEMIRGYMLVIGGLCTLLALIGIANVFSNTLGFLRQRRREFARYMSVGLTDAGMRKMFGIEALVIAGRPLLITLPLTALFIAFAIKASYLDPMEFVVRMPIIPVSLFALMIFLAVGTAYYIGGKRLLRCGLSEALKDDTMA